MNKFLFALVGVCLASLSLNEAFAKDCKNVNCQKEPGNRQCCQPAGSEG